MKTSNITVNAQEVRIDKDGSITISSPSLRVTMQRVGDISNITINGQTCIESDSTNGELSIHSLGDAPADDPGSIKYGRRVWVNQPSTGQPCHAFHGMNGIAIQYDERRDLVYTLSGPTVSLVLPKSALSDGWVGDELAGAK